MSEPVVRFTFRPYERLKKQADFKRIKCSGTRVRGKHFLLNYIENGLPNHRLGVVVSKRYYKKSVRRNRIKRCVREWFRLHKHDINKPGKDIVVVAIREMKDLSCRKVAEELCELCAKSGLGHLSVRF